MPGAGGSGEGLSVGFRWRLPFVRLPSHPVSGGGRLADSQAGGAPVLCPPGSIPVARVKAHFHAVKFPALRVYSRQVLYPI